MRSLFYRPLNVGRLTYMSISDEIRNRCTEGRLLRLEALADPRAYQVASSDRQTIYVSPDIAKYLEWDDELAAIAQADLEDFILGREMAVALKRERHQGCRMARLDRPRDEVWEIRVHEAKPQLRFFGRFAECDVFIVLIGPIGRRDLFGKGWDRIKRECQTKWERLFGLNPPVIGRTIHDYISKKVRVV